MELSPSARPLRVVWIGCARVVVVAGVLVGAGCGGASAHPSAAAKKAYVKRVQSIGDRYGASASSILRPVVRTLGRDNAKAAQQMTRGALVYAREADALAAITPPGEVSADHHALVSWLRGQARFESGVVRLFKSSAGGASKEHAFTSLLAENKAALNRRNAALRDFKRKGYDLVGFTGVLEMATEALASEPLDVVPRWVKAEKLPRAALPGAKLFAVAGCTACHTYLGSGAANLDAPDLTAIGLRHLGISFQIRHLKCPSCVSPGSPMPRFAVLGETRLRELAIFLESSNGKR
jgi:mono/diheme cytochrome c family protein